MLSLAMLSVVVPLIGLMEGLYFAKALVCQVCRIYQMTIKVRLNESLNSAVTINRLDNLPKP
jgi:hypothetical protein